MSVQVSHFSHLEQRCNELIAKYLDPIIAAEQSALSSDAELPSPDFDSMAAFRLLSHAELEGYFERKSQMALDRLENDFKTGKFATSQAAALVFLFLWKTQSQPNWADKKNMSTAEYRDAELTDFKNLTQQALGFGRQFINNNNGIKENSITTLSALMGFFADQVDNVLITELGQYGAKRGDVAHDSWVHNTRTFDSADIEKNRILNILVLIKNSYELPTGQQPLQKKQRRRSFFFLKFLLNPFRTSSTTIAN